ncbi:MAG: hypothetical protein Kapaf2KO_09870 [Candidatus Kapaibacteriales bacterium]
MSTNVTFRHFNAKHPELEATARDVVDGFHKYIDDIHSANVIFNNEKEKEVEIVIRVDGQTLAAKDATDEFRKSLSSVEDKIIRQIKKYKTKHSNH